MRPQELEAELYPCCTTSSKLVSLSMPQSFTCKKKEANNGYLPTAIVSTQRSNPFKSPKKVPR